MCRMQRASGSNYSTPHQRKKIPCFSQGKHPGRQEGQGREETKRILQARHPQATHRRNTRPAGAGRNQKERERLPTGVKGQNLEKKNSRSASRGTPRTGPRQGRKGRNKTPTRGQTPEFLSNRVKEIPGEHVFPTLHGGEERKKNSRPSQKGNPLTAGPAQHPRIRRIPAEGKPHRNTQEAKPSGTSPNSVKPRGQRGRTCPQLNGQRQENHTSPRRHRQVTCEG